jgi:RNA polymerase sigma-70 factor, ECF subfamily
VQDVFLELIGRPPAVPPESWAAVLRWTTARRALDRLRRRRAARETTDGPLANLPARAHEAVGEACAGEMLDWLRSAVTRLPPRQAEVFTLRCFAELSYDEIAAASGLKVGAVGTILHEARRELQAMLPGEWVEPRKARTSRERV